MEQLTDVALSDLSLLEDQVPFHTRTVTPHYGGCQARRNLAEVLAGLMHPQGSKETQQQAAEARTHIPVTEPPKTLCVPQGLHDIILAESMPEVTLVRASSVVLRSCSW